MINNYNNIFPLLEFKSKDDFYFLQIIKRKKENPELKNNSIVLKTYYITSVEHLYTIMPQIISMCNANNARACINLNVRSFERVGFMTLKKVTDLIMNKQYKDIKSAYDSVCGETGCSRKESKTWIIDVDYTETTKLIILYNEYDMIKRLIHDASPVGDKVVRWLPTKNGFHMIVKPFDLSFVNIPHDIHKNNPTNLYIP